jgi:hypothetical protein
MGRLMQAAVVGVLVGWGVTEVLGIAGSLGSTSLGRDAKSGLYVGIFGLIFGGALVCSDWVRAGDWDGAGKRLGQVAVPLAAASFVAGFLAQVIYAGIIEGLTLQERFELTANSGTLYLARMIAWGLFGAGIGCAIGLVNKSREQTINAGIGGLVGGAVGGLAFEFAAAHIESASGSILRLIGLMAIGVLVAVGMQFVEAARREAWLEITGGGMAGKEFILYHERTHIGSSPDCEIYLLKDPAVEKFHALIESANGRRTITALGDAVVSVNGQTTRSAALGSGDAIQIGNTTIRFSERSADGV